MAAAKTLLFVALGALALTFAVYWARSARAATARPTPFHLFVGFVTDFFDTLGIGSYATTTSLYRLRRAVDDRLIPGTLNVGHGIPTFAQAFIYITVVKVDMATLLALIASSVAGAWLGAGVVAGFDRRKVQLGMGIALFAAAILLFARLMELLPSGGDALALSGALFAAGVFANFIFGALMTIGIGAYAPIMITVSMLGMNPTTAFPIMMGSCAFLMPVASFRFIKTGAYDLRAALGLTAAGLPAVLIAGLIVKELPLDYVRWLVLVVVVYTAATMLRAASREPVALPPQANG